MEEFVLAILVNVGSGRGEGVRFGKFECRGGGTGTTAVLEGGRRSSFCSFCV